MEILLKDFGGYFYGIFGLGGHDILGPPSHVWHVGVEFHNVVVAGLLMETLLSVLVLILLAVAELGVG